MSETKHTPGPWAVCEEPAPNDYWFPGITIGAEPKQDARRVCDVFTGGMKGADINPMHAANARLIAAAPELLAMLQHVYAHGYGSVEHCMLSELLNKATGATP